MGNRVGVFSRFDGGPRSVLCPRRAVGLVSEHACGCPLLGGIDVLRVRRGSLGRMLDNNTLVVRGPLAMN